LVVVNFFLIFN